jgi:hypothetical protein
VPGKHRGPERVQIRLSGEPNIALLERARGGQQQGSSFAITASGERNSRPSEIDPSAPQFVERSRFPGVEHRNRLFEPPGLEFGLCGLERPLPSADRILCQIARSS